MAVSIFGDFLSNVTQFQLDSLCQTLWDWKTCNDCSLRKQCADGECPWKRTQRLRCFFDFYKTVTASYVPDLNADQPALRTHEDLFALFRALKAQPDEKRADFTKAHLANRNVNSVPSTGFEDQERAVALAVRVRVMMNCSVGHNSADMLELGIMRIPWQQEATLKEYLVSAFPATDCPALNENTDGNTARNIKIGVKASPVQKRAGLECRGTNDLRNHIRVDPD